MCKIKLPILTLDLLKDKSTGESFIRGRDYYHDGLVSNLRVEDNSYIASVAGSYHYEVKITQNNNDIDFSCTCPYDWGGICKHCIAVGLYILNRDKKVVKKTKIRKKLKIEDKIDLLKILNEATSKQKDEFLQKIFRENQEYKEKFLAVVLPQTGLESNIIIDAVRDKVIDILENFDLINYQRFYDHYDKSYGYRDEWEVIFDGANEELENSLDFITIKIERNIKNGNIIDASKLLLGLYEGISLADCYEISDPASVFDGELNNQVETFFLEFFGNIIPSFLSASKTSQASFRIIDIFFERVISYNKSTFEDFRYDFFLFRDFFNTLIIDQVTAKYLLSYIKKLKLLNLSTDTVQLKIYDTLNDKQKWLLAAEKYYKNNPEIAQELLDYYKTSDMDKFIEIGKIVFQKWANDFDEYLYKNLNIKDNSDFFEKILFHLADRTQSLPLFSEIKENYGNESANRFIEKVKQKTIFYINLLNEQKEYKTILNFLKKNTDDWHFMKIIKPIMNIYPDECLNIIKNKTDEYLKENIGRKYYVDVAHWLELLLLIKDPKIKSEINSYFQELLQKYKMRPALKDELKKVRIK